MVLAGLDITFKSTCFVGYSMKIIFLMDSLLPMWAWNFHCKRIELIEFMKYDLPQPSWLFTFSSTHHETFWPMLYICLSKGNICHLFMHFLLYSQEPNKSTGAFVCSIWFFADECVYLYTFLIFVMKNPTYLQSLEKFIYNFDLWPHLDYFCFQLHHSFNFKKNFFIRSVKCTEVVGCEDNRK